MSLVVSIHDVAPQFAEEIGAMVSRLQHQGVRRFSLFVVPFYHERQRLSDFPEFVAQLRRWEEEGAEIVLHGWSHRESQPNRRWWHRVMTAGEGEFAELSHLEAMERLRRGKELLVQLGFSVAGFVAPAWLASDGTKQALRDLAFEYTEDHLFVRLLSSKKKIFSPTIAYIHRSPMRRRMAFGLNGLLSLRLARWRLVRLALHPPDLRDPHMWRQVEKILSRATKQTSVESTRSALEQLS